MSSTITPVSQYGGTLTIPSNGDDLDADTVAAAFQTVADRAEHLLDATEGAIVWGHKARVAPGGAASGNTGVFVPMVEAVSILDGSTRRAVQVSGETQLTTTDHHGGVSLSASTWYYVYAFISAGALALEISADAPEAGLVWKSGAGRTHRYLFCFRTDGSGVPIPMQMTRGRYVYRYSSIASGYNIAGYTATQAFTDLSLSTILPLHARIAHLLIEAINGDTDAGDELTVRVRTNGDTTGYDGVTVPPAAAGDSDSYARGLLYTECETDASQLVEVEVSGSSGALAVNVFARGFSE